MGVGLGQVGVTSTPDGHGVGSGWGEHPHPMAAQQAAPLVPSLVCGQIPCGLGSGSALRGTGPHPRGMVGRVGGAVSGRFPAPVGGMLALASGTPSRLWPLDPGWPCAILW